MSVLASSGYRRLWAARTVSQWGDIAQFTALTLLVFHLTGSGLGVSGVAIAEIVPVLVLAPLAGPLVDRLPRVTVMIGADLARPFWTSVCRAAMTTSVFISDILEGLVTGKQSAVCGQRPGPIGQAQSLRRRAAAATRRR